MKLPQPFEMPFPSQANELGRFKRPSRLPVVMADSLLDSPLASMRVVLQEGMLRKPSEWPDFRRHLWPRFKKRLIDRGHEEWLPDIEKNVYDIAVGAVPIVTPDAEPKNPRAFWWMPLPWRCRFLGEADIVTSILDPSETIVRPMVANPYLPPTHKISWRDYI